MGKHTLTFDEAKQIYLDDLRTYGQAGLLPVQEFSTMTKGIWDLRNKAVGIARVSTGGRCVLEIAVPLRSHPDDEWVE